jgi:hypothetical protein
MLLAVLMVPTMVAFVVDGSRGRKFAVTVGMMNFAGCAPAVAELWSRGQSFEAALLGIGDVFSWAVALMASGVGWMIYWIMPPIISSYHGIASKTQVLGLRSHQKKLIADWGEEVAAVIAERVKKPEEAEAEE